MVLDSLLVVYSGRCSAKIGSSPGTVAKAELLGCRLTIGECMGPSHLIHIEYGNSVVHVQQDVGIPHVFGK